MGLLDLFVSGESSSKFTIKTNGVLWKEKSKQTKIQESVEKIYKFEISIHSQREKKIERGLEEKRESSPIPVLPPPGFGIVRILASCLGIY